MSFFLGYCFGAFLTLILLSWTIVKNVIGTLKIDRSNPNKDKFLFVVSKNPDDIGKRKYVYLKVEVKGPSQY